VDVPNETAMFVFHRAKIFLMMLLEQWDVDRDRA
jgi:hypothetical protein